MRKIGDDWLKRAKAKFKTGDGVIALDSAAGCKQVGRVEGIFENFLLVLFGRGYRQSYIWHKVALGKVKKF